MSLTVYVRMDQHRIGLCHSLKRFSFLLTNIILPIVLATEGCRNCLDGECTALGECTKGCIEGYADKYCQHKCQPTCKDANCQLDMNTGKMICLFGCEDGYCGKQCKTPCVDGCLKCDNRTCTCSRCNGSFYGDKCQHSCLDGCLICDHKGQCLSCKDGLHGRNCEQMCSSKCIRCKQETGNCIKCQQGFRGDSCNQESSEKTTEVILVTSTILPIDLANERCRNCLEGECQASGECTQGCINGFADKYCQYKCQSTCKDANCQLDEDTGKMICPSGCEDGYCGQQCKAPCVDGCLKCDNRRCTCPRCNGSFYGDSCHHSCLDGCLACDNKGQCLSCRDGFHGRNCEQICSSKCIRCKQETGKCIKCQQGFLGDSCNQGSTEKTTEIKPDALDANPEIVIPMRALMFVLICCLPLTLVLMIWYLKGCWEACKKKIARNNYIGGSRSHNALLRDKMDSKSCLNKKPKERRRTLSGGLYLTRQPQRKHCEEEETAFGLA